MTHATIPAPAPISRRTILFEILFFVVLTQITKATISLVTWRYAGPITLVLILGLIFIYMRSKGRSLSSIGLIRLTTAKSYLLLLPQIGLAFIASLAVATLVALGGEALGLEFMQADPTGAEDRFGDLAGNTPLYLSWLVILWIAGPAEELFFRGYLISRSEAFFGKGRGAVMLSVLLPAILFGWGHVYYQGLRGFIVTGTIGLTLGILFLLYKRNLWPLMIAHACVNTLMFTAQYLELDF